jgi:hypothetical protein
MPAPATTRSGMAQRGPTEARKPWTIPSGIGQLSEKVGLCSTYSMRIPSGPVTNPA